LKYIREIYVFDSWFHLNKLEQVIGRGIRYCSHALLKDDKEDKRNCTIYLLVNAFREGDRETMDMYSYRRAIRKAA
jgi:type I site-specific restriction endonuclease